MPQTLRFYRRNLPHWLVAEAAYFVTIRLSGTLPRAILEQLAAERDQLRELQATDDDWLKLERRQFVRIERILDACQNGHAWLRDGRVARLVLTNLDWLRTRGWRVLAAVVMSNHLHALLQHTAGRNGELLTDLGQFKNYTGRAANKILDRSGAFWAREDFDHWVRSPAKFDAAVHYILNNPVSAQLVRHWRDWPWMCVEDELAALGD